MAKKRRIVFISHCGTDTWVAKKVADEITSRGAQPFLEEVGGYVGTEFEEEIRNMLEKTSEHLVLYTPRAISRPYIWAEIGVSWSRRILIAVLLCGLTKEEFLSNINVPVFLKGRDTISINDIDRYLDELHQRVNNVKGRGKK
ncbi:MAG: toll/interleukin-1 receptor domain-containing protein [Candidatus Magnetobacterium sp. LHC-1]|nr:toll/interleukin-1 receptor domain-containing protein [Nitrospirota bacterium]